MTLQERFKALQKEAHDVDVEVASLERYNKDLLTKLQVEFSASTVDEGQKKLEALQQQVQQCDGEIAEIEKTLNEIMGAAVK